MAGIVVVVALLTGVSVVAWTWRHPTAFGDAPSEVSTSADTWHVDEAIFVGMTYPVAEGSVPVTLHEAEANVVTNTADATITFGICTLTPDKGTIGSVRAKGFSTLCTSWLPVADHRLASSTDQPEQLLMKVTPHQPGSVEIAGAAVTYSDGWQRGAQDIGEYLSLRVP
ncbi:hypothetical protein BH09ACT12_BH09ACT12_08180 [soil metagenome]